MEYEVYQPRPPLSHFVEYLWALRDQPGHATERIVPTATLELVINLSDDEIRIYDRDGVAFRRFSGGVVSGAYRRYFVIDTQVHTSIMGVHFRYGTAGRVLGLPAGELADGHAELEALWGTSALELREQLCEAPTTAARFAVLEQLLCARLTARAGHHAVPFALAELANQVTVGDVAAQLDLSRRRLIEVFTAEVGITPKRFSRILRFQRATAFARDPQMRSWGELAIACGYFDQAHLIHDFRELTGMLPTEFVAGSADVKRDHVAVRSNSSKP